MTSSCYSQLCTLYPYFVVVLSLKFYPNFHFCSAVSKKCYVLLQLFNLLIYWMFYVQVCRQLDGLSHFHYTPKPVVSESRIYGSGPEAALPSLSLEDIIPTTENSSTILAPEEVRSKFSVSILIFFFCDILKSQFSIFFFYNWNLEFHMSWKIFHISFFFFFFSCISKW